MFQEKSQISSEWLQFNDTVQQGGKNMSRIDKTSLDCFSNGLSPISILSI